MKKGDLTYTIRMSQDANKVWITKITFSGDSVEKIQIPDEFDDAPVVRIGKPGKGNEYYTVVGTTVCPDNNKDGEYSDPGWRGSEKCIQDEKCKGDCSSGHSGAAGRKDPSADLRT